MVFLAKLERRTNLQSSAIAIFCKWQSATFPAVPKLRDTKSWLDGRHGCDKMNSDEFLAMHVMGVFTSRMKDANKTHKATSTETGPHRRLCCRSIAGKSLETVTAHDVAAAVLA